MTNFSQITIVTQDGSRLVADVGGSQSAPNVILLHGGGQTRHSWSRTMRCLVHAGYRVTNYDTRGHGDSDWSPDGIYSIELLISDLETVALTANRPLALIGASMGGLTSFHALGRSKSQLADALIMVDIVPHPTSKGVDRIRVFMQAHNDGFGSLEEAASAVAKYNPARSKRADLHGLMKNLRLQDDGRLYWH